jgi:hypothetical protein
MIHKVTDAIDLQDSAASGAGLAALSRAAGTYNTTGVDLTKYEGGCAYDISAGAVTGTLDVKLQDSADNSTFADVAPAVAITQLAAAGHATLNFRTRQCRQYVRISAVSVTGPAVFSATFVGQKRSA